MKLEIPQSLKIEHEALHSTLVKATKVAGATGEAARAVAVALHPHFVKEEQLALPALALLAPLARGQLTPEMREVVLLTDRLRTELPQMLAEHRAIVAALDKLVEAARADGHTQYADFAEELKLHARTEEEVMYPAAVLVGEYIKRAT